jgi:FkbM family methyltransferase
MGTATVRTRYGFRMQLHLDDWVDQHIYATGLYEDYTAHLLATLVRPGDWAIDVGANIGFFTLLMARQVGPTGRVVAFEPAASTRARLTHNIKLNHLTDVEIHAEAVAEVDGQASFFTGAKDHSGMASLRVLEQNSPAATVRTCRLDDCIAETQRVGLIKIDVEGAEHAAVRGMERTLRHWHPDLIVEISDDYLKEMGRSGQQLTDLVLGLGYRMYLIDWNGLVPLAGWAANLPAQFNALFTVRPELPATLVIKPGSVTPGNVAAALGEH